MSIKVSIAEKAKAAKWDYPLLVQHIYGSGTIVLAIGKSDSNAFAGIVLQSSAESLYKVGKYSPDWAALNFHPFPGTITLKNNGGAE